MMEARPQSAVSSPESGHRSSCSLHSCKSHSDIAGADGETNLNSMKDEIIKFAGNWRRLRLRLALIVSEPYNGTRAGLGLAWSEGDDVIALAVMTPLRP